MDNAKHIIWNNLWNSPNYNRLYAALALVLHKKLKNKWFRGEYNTMFLLKLENCEDQGAAVNAILKNTGITILKSHEQWPYDYCRHKVRIDKSLI